MALWPASFTDARISVTQGLDLDLRSFLVASMSPSTVLTKSIAFVGPLVAGTSLSLWPSHVSRDGQRDLLKSNINELVEGTKR